MGKGGFFMTGEFYVYGNCGKEMEEAVALIEIYGYVAKPAVIPTLSLFVDNICGFDINPPIIDLGKLRFLLFAIFIKNNSR